MGEIMPEDGLPSDFINAGLLGDPQSITPVQAPGEIELDPCNTTPSGKPRSHRFVIAAKFTRSNERRLSPRRRSWHFCT
jgi:hypothetical protein